MEQKTQPSSYVERFNQLTNEMMESAVTKEEVKQAMDVFIANFNQLREQIVQKMAENKVEMKNETARLGTEVADFEKRMRTVVSDGDSKNKQYIDNEINKLSSSIGYLEDFVENYESYDDEQLSIKLSELENRLNDLKIPSEFDASKIENDIEQIKDDVQALKNRPVRMGGGVTDMALKIAMSRIVQTVTPTGTINGSNTDFTVPSTIHAVLGFELNSRSIDPGTYTITGQKRMGISFDTAIPASYAGKQFTIIYI